MLSNTAKHPSPKFQWARPPPRVLVTADTPSFDAKTLQALRSEGFQISYLHFDGDRKTFGNNIMKIAEPLELGDYWAIIAYGRAASAALDVCMKPVPKLSALVTYYPHQLPSTSTNLPPNLVSVVHIAGDQNIGSPKYPSYHYPHAKEGFAETESDAFSQVASDLAWSRTLTALRKGFGIDADVENIWEKHLSAEFLQRDVYATMDTMAKNPTVNFVPTMAGGVGAEELERFYEDYFISKVPASMKMRLLSRTIGVDRVVDEMVLTFTHDQDMPWILPGVEPTNKHIEVAMVMIVGIRGKKIYTEHVYWDQASVLAQAGLIDPKKLPVVGSEGAQKLLNNESIPSNELLQRKSK